MDSKKNKAGAELNRRGFLKLSTGAALAGVGSSMLPGVALADDDREHISSFRHHGNDRRLWQKVRKEFVLSKRETYMNVGTTGSIPERVLENYEDNNEYISKHPWGTQVSTTELSKQVAASFGADAHELILSRNTTDGMCSIIHGLNFQAGDVILTTNQEHVGGAMPMKIVAQRYDVEVVELTLPTYTGYEFVTEDDYVRLFADAVALYGDRVRLICFSHVSYKTGVALPAKRICKEVAVPNRIPTLVDGAHTPGMFALDFHDIDCDFYAGSGHKWQCGPGSTGILYVRDCAKRLRDFWYDRPQPLFFVNSSYPSGTDVEDAYNDPVMFHQRFQYVGQDNYPAKQALVECCQMWDAIGRDRIERRILELSAMCKAALRYSFDSDATYYSPDVAELSSGLTTFNPFWDKTDGVLLTEFRDRLREDYGYIIRTTNFKLHPDDAQDTYALRISTHLFHDEDDVLGLVRAMKRVYRQLA
ncbi:aminotransferase class V-fold PLP-dependent enzyme [Shewanella sp. GXUN23E]|uniref:aminotransferase class V-fold PLP-dependent enzyme n=1 Tax=Shewanella sp. GXUN23E TaxID=3422498 RepID=UPI003D7D3AFE